MQTLRSRILEVDQQLRTVSQPAHVARDRDAALAEQEVSRAAGDCRRRPLPAVEVVTVAAVVVMVVVAVNAMVLCECYEPVGCSSEDDVVYIEDSS